MKHPPYPRYKPSGVEWLGEVPEHWEVKRLKRAATYRVSNVDKVPALGEVPVRLCNYTDVYHHEFISPKMDLMEGTASADEIRRFGLQVRDVLITKDSEAWDDIAVPALVVETDADLVCGYHLAIIRAVEHVLCGPFLFRALQSSAINQQFQVAASGVTRFGLPKSAIGDAWVPMPRPPEQRAIADFLDAQTAKLDALVAKKRALIEKLKEKRTALIARVVTRGLPPDAARAGGFDPHPRLRPSGTEWLGDVPEHWSSKSIKAFARVGNGSTPNRENPDYWSEGGFPWLNSSVVNLREVRAPTDFVTLMALRECHLPRITPPAMLVGITGEGRTRGMATMLQIEATINQHLAFVKPRSDECCVVFLRYVFDHAYQFLRIESDGGGSTKGAITCEQISNLHINLPPSLEQRAIADYLDDETAKIDRMAEKVEAAIERLLEYRSTLITAAVTGKIDVRAIAEVALMSGAGTPLVADPRLGPDSE